MLGGALQAQVDDDPHCPVTRYLLGCWHFDRGRPAIAVQQMMIAHRIEPALQSAALLAFAGLNWGHCRQRQLLPVLLETWEEFRRPEFDRFAKERRLLDAFARPDPGLDALPPLARRLWRLPLRTLRAQIEEAVVSRDAALYPQLATPA